MAEESALLALAGWACRALLKLLTLIVLGTCIVLLGSGVVGSIRTMLLLLRCLCLAVLRDRTKDRVQRGAHALKKVKTTPHRCHSTVQVGAGAHQSQHH